VPIRLPIRSAALCRALGAVLATLCVATLARSIAAQSNGGAPQSNVAPKPVASRGIQGRDYAALAKLPDFSGMWQPLADPSVPPPSFSRTPGPSPDVPGVGDASSRLCRPHGMPEVMGSVFPLEFLFTPGRVTINLEFEHLIRRIYTDGRPHPEDPDLSYMGDSIGHWEGATLVVDTIAIKSSDDGSDRGLHLVERFDLADPDTLRVDSTAYIAGVAQPRRLSSRFQRNRDWSAREYFCEENPRDTLGPNSTPSIDFKQK